MKKLSIHIVCAIHGPLDVESYVVFNMKCELNFSLCEKIIISCSHHTERKNVYHRKCRNMNGVKRRREITSCSERFEMSL